MGKRSTNLIESADTVNKPEIIHRTKQNKNEKQNSKPHLIHSGLVDNIFGI